jgi:hypothetical protein
MMTRSTIRHPAHARAPIALACLAACAGLIAAAPARAAPTAGAYTTDVTQSHVEDATGQGLKLPNTVLCFMNATGANQTEVVNQGSYLALVDEGKCDNGGANANADSGSAAQSSAPRYIRAAVNSTRVDNNTALIGKVWFTQDEMRTQGGGSAPGLIYARLQASAPASADSPYGIFHTDFCGIADGDADCAMRGYAAGDGSSVRAFQIGDGNVSMVLTGTTAAGQGRVKVSENSGAAAADWVFAYDASYFRRRAAVAGAGAGGGGGGGGGGSEQCFDRSFANADKTAWRYGVYNADGSRLERMSGFPIKAGNAYGYVGYWGLWLQGGATLDDGASVTRYAYSNQQAVSGDYTLVKKDGRLKKQTLHTTTLDGIRNVPFAFWVNQGFADSASVQRSPGTSLELKWDGSHFVITGVMQNGQTVPEAAGNYIPDAALASTWNINSWSQSLGGPISVQTRNAAGTYVAPNMNTVVSYRTETVVTPGSSDWPTQLHCVSDCPAGGSTFTSGLDNPGNADGAYANFGGPAASRSSIRNWQPVLAGSEVSYVADASTGLISTAGAAVAWTSLASPANGQYQNGFQSGRLVDSAGLASLACGVNGGDGSGYYCPNRAENVSTLYVWETGPNSWNKFSGLRNAGGYVHFDAPLSLAYTVPAQVSASYNGAQLVLQYNGFGDLQGVPGKCVDAGTNLEVPCSNNGSTRWVAAFVIPEGSTLSDGSTSYYVKPLEQELRLRKVAAGNCAALTLPSIADSAMPGLADFSDPRVNGAMPSLTGAPRVIQGVLQY